MDASVRGPVIYPLETLPPERFESLVFLLARSTDSRVLPVRVKDHGLDARLPDEHMRTLRGWQAKHFTDGIHWPQCQNKDCKRAGILASALDHILFCPRPLGD